MGMIALYGPSAHGREGKLFRGKFKPLWYSQASRVLQFEHFFCIYDKYGLFILHE